MFDFTHAEIAALVGKTEASSRQLLKRARESVEEERRVLTTSVDEHRRLLAAFLRAAASGQVEDLMPLLDPNVVLIADGGPTPTGFGRLRNLPAPISGARKVAAFVASVTPQGSSGLGTRQ